MTYTTLYVRQLNCFVMFIWDLGPVKLVLVQMRDVFHILLDCNGVVPGVLVAGWCSLDRTSMSRLLVSRLYAISVGWLEIIATSACDSNWIGWFCVHVLHGCYTNHDRSLAAVLLFGWRVCWRGIVLTFWRAVLTVAVLTHWPTDWLVLVWPTRTTHWLVW